MVTEVVPVIVSGTLGVPPPTVAPLTTRTAVDATLATPTPPLIVTACADENDACRSAVCPAEVGPVIAAALALPSPRRIGSPLLAVTGSGAFTLSKRYTPCHLSPVAMDIASLPFGTSVTVLVGVVNGAIFQVPFSVPPALVISTQCAPK